MTETLPAIYELKPEPRVPSVPSYMRSLAEHGLVGRIVDCIDPYTEADRHAVLVSLLVAFGSAVGRAPHVMVGADVHHANLFAVLVGRSSKARKGQSWSPIWTLMNAVDPYWTADRIHTGLGSGEGLISVVRDGDEEHDGVTDKRALILATEFASVLHVVARQGSTLSPVLRDAWDRGNLRVTTKNAPIRATGTHVSVLAHITEGELRRLLTSLETSNGFANRFTYFHVDRSKVLAEPQPFDVAGLGTLVRELHAALDQARRTQRVERDEHARELWAEHYPSLSRDRYGLSGALTDRAEAQVLRFSLVYALLDSSRLIREEHLVAALALWAHCESSVEKVFGTATGDPIADRIEAAVDERGVLSKTDISNLFERNLKASAIDSALGLLLELRRIERIRQPTGGRPAEVFMRPLDARRAYEGNEVDEESPEEGRP